MRESFFERSWIRNDDGGIAGFCLGYDHCAEHEWGIKSINAAFGLTDAFGLGIERSRVRKVPEHLKFQVASFAGKGRRSRKRVKIATLVYSDFDSVPLLPHAIYREEEKDSDNEGQHLTSAQWGDDGFSVSVMGDENMKRLRSIYDAIVAGDACIALAGRQNPFSGAGLCLVIASRISQSVVDMALKADESDQRLREAVRATGIQEELAAANLKCELMPRWTDETETSINYWVDPRDHRKYSYGWHKLEDIRAWIRGEGPIVKQA